MTPRSSEKSSEATKQPANHIVDINVGGPTIITGTAAQAKLFSPADREEVSQKALLTTTDEPLEK